MFHILNKLGKTAKYFDGFAQKVELKIQGESENKLLIGSLITIFTTLLSIILTLPTFLQFVNKTNPEITTSIQYATQNLTIDYSNFFFGLSFFYPLKDVRDIKSTSNDYSAIKFINQLNISCTTCKGEYLSNESIMNLCNPMQFKNLTLKSMAKGKSNGINTIFSDYSFCFPSDLSSVIKDNNNPDSMEDTSLQIFIPVNEKSVEFTNVKTNKLPQPGIDYLTSKLQSNNKKSLIEEEKPLVISDNEYPIFNTTINTKSPNNTISGLGKPNPIIINSPVFGDRKCPICPTLNSSVTCKIYIKIKLIYLLFCSIYILII
jgi:hypothetical protein